MAHSDRAGDSAERMAFGTELADDLAALLDRQVSAISLAVSAVESAGGFRPPLDLGPVPDVADAEACDGLGKIVVPPTPGVHRLGLIEPETVCNLRRAH